MHKRVNQGYEVYPLVVPANQDSTIRIRPRFGHLAFPPQENISVLVRGVDGTGSPVNELDQELAYLELKKFQLLPDGTLEITAHFYDEQAHRIILELKNPGCQNCSTWARREHEQLKFTVYSVHKDLQKLRPFRGDFHMHTCYSDGVETPAYVAARNREFGMDFIAITDHRRYEPSLQAIKFWQDNPTELKLFPGEEVHADKNAVHIINFGGQKSINAAVYDHLEQYHAEVQQRLAAMTDLPSGLSQHDKFMIAASEWVFDHIREVGGLALFCHPYWETSGNVLNVGLIREIYRRRKFDATEIIAGYEPQDWFSNNSQIVHCYEEWEKRGRFPIVGVSDAHGTEKDSETSSLANWYSTIVLAENDDFGSIAKGILELRAVAVQKVGTNALPGMFGDLRMVRYCQFLWEHYFPLHDELCQVEGALMRDLVGGGIAGATARTALQAVVGRCAKYREACFAGC